MFELLRFDCIRKKLGIRNSKQIYFDKLDRLSSSENSSSSLFWKASTQMSNLGRSANNIPTHRIYNRLTENKYQKAQKLNLYVASQSVVNDAKGVTAL